MLLLITFLGGSAVFLLLYVLLITCVPTSGPIEMRLKALTVKEEKMEMEEELAQPFSKRIFSPLANGLAEIFMRMTPTSLRRIIEDRMAMAGGFGRLNVDQMILLCSFLAISLPGIIRLLLITLKVSAAKVIGISIMSFGIGFFIPIFFLAQKIARRKLHIQKELPDVLDLLTVSVEAGLGFDGALSKLTEKMKGVLVEEFNRVLQEIRMGVSRRDALVALGKRCDVPDLSLFTTALIQADQLGVSISNVLRVQSVSMREKRKQRIEEKAMKAPIKMMLPLVMFIFPTIFIVLLGPAIIQIFKTIGSK